MSPPTTSLVMPTYLAAQEKKKRHIRQKMEFQLLASYNSASYSIAQRVKKALLSVRCY